MRGEALIDGITVVTADDVLRSKEAVLERVDFLRFEAELKSMTKEKYAPLFESDGFLKVSLTIYIPECL